MTMKNHLRNRKDKNHKKTDCTEINTPMSQPKKDTPGYHIERTDRALDPIKILVA